MVQTKFTQEERIVLKAVNKDPGMPLRYIHEAATSFEDSPFAYSPAFGDGWNDERHKVQSILWELKKRGLAKNKDRDWYLTVEGQELV